MELRTELSKSRFEIEKLEERIAPRNQGNGDNQNDEDADHVDDDVDQDQGDGQN